MTNNSYGLLNLVSRSTFLSCRAAQLFLRLISRGGWGGKRKKMGSGETRTGYVKRKQGGG